MRSMRWPRMPTHYASQSEGENRSQLIITMAQQIARQTETKGEPLAERRAQMTLPRLAASATHILSSSHCQTKCQM